jgi:hypothetical protein
LGETESLVTPKGFRLDDSLQFQTIRHNGSGNRGNSSGNAFIITFPEPLGARSPSATVLTSVLVCSFRHEMVNQSFDY